MKNKLGTFVVLFISANLFPKAYANCPNFAGTYHSISFFENGTRMTISEDVVLAVIQKECENISFTISRLDLEAPISKSFAFITDGKTQNQYDLPFFQEPIKLLMTFQFSSTSLEGQLSILTGNESSSDSPQKKKDMGTMQVNLDASNHLHATMTIQSEKNKANFDIDAIRN